MILQNKKKLSEFSFFRVPKNFQVTSEIDFNRTFASVFVRANAKKIKSFLCSATVQKNRVFSAQGKHNEIMNIGDMIVWISKLTLCP